MVNLKQIAAAVIKAMELHETSWNTRHKKDCWQEAFADFPADFAHIWYPMFLAEYWSNDLHDRR